MRRMRAALAVASALTAACSGSSSTDTLTLVGRGPDVVRTSCSNPGPEMVLPELDDTPGYYADVAVVCAATPEPYELRGPSGRSATRGEGTVFWAPVGIEETDFECASFTELGVSHWLHRRVTVAPAPLPRPLDVEGGGSYLLTPVESWLIDESGSCEVMAGTWELAPGSGPSPLGTSGTFTKRSDSVQVAYVLERGP